MYNKYTIELAEKDGEVKATIYLRGNSLGKIWRPGNKLVTKEDFQELFQSVGSVIYGQEDKAAKEEESDSKIIANITSLYSTGQEN